MSRPRLAQLPGTQDQPLARRLALTIRACLRGLVELARARVVFARKSPRELLATNDRLANHCRDGTKASRADAILVEQVAWVVPRLASRVPWRADCMVQAIAAQHWLEARGIATRLVIGAERDRSKPFSAHAWLVHGDAVVTGGDIQDFEILAGEIGDTDEKSGLPRIDIIG